MRYVKILLVDDHKIIRQGMRALLEERKNLIVIGEASDGAEAISMVEKLRPDLLLIDMMMPNLNGIDAAYQIHKYKPDIKIIFLTMHANPSYALRAFQVGAMGYVLKQGDFSEILDCVNSVIEGRRYVSSAIADEVTYALSSTGLYADALESPLSPREKEVLQLIVEGNSNRSIASKLTLSVRTVEAHRARIKAKLKASSQADLVRYAIQHGIISP